MCSQASNPAAPAFDFLRSTFIPLIEQMGPTVKVALQRYGVARVFGLTRAGDANVSPFGSPWIPAIFEVVDLNWSGREDLNLRPPGPEP
ncbi:MAG: hypothetical protein WB919_17090, partial [Candidatus Sulfotelmatobacter sp.]